MARRARDSVLKPASASDRQPKLYNTVLVYNLETVLFGMPARLDHSLGRA